MLVTQANRFHCLYLQSKATKKHVRDELLAGGGTTSGGESGGSPITVMQMKGATIGADQEKVEIETQTEKPGNEDKETGITQEEMNEMSEKECRETQVYVFNHYFS